MSATFILASRGSLTLEHALRAISELRQGSDRAVAIVGGALIEIALTEALKIHLHPNKKITDELFRTTGAFGAFATKVHLGKLVGLYGAQAHKDLTIVKDIRNAFAHSLEVSDFSTQKIRDWANNLRLCERYTMDNENPPPRPVTIREGPIGQRDWWLSVTNRNAALSNPRERYLITTQVFTYGLAVPSESAMPEPPF